MIAAHSPPCLPASLPHTSLCFLLSLYTLVGNSGSSLISLPEHESSVPAWHGAESPGTRRRGRRDQIARESSIRSFRTRGSLRCALTAISGTKAPPVVLELFKIHSPCSSMSPQTCVSALGATRFIYAGCGGGAAAEEAVRGDTY
ncbi:hypothetical protein NQZ68_027486 [Dissostichus eleginoides]|nr:hypothetical protein NQZ68_027486 [Dissostichus eleginoides]